MKAILSFGNTGTTLKAANLLQERLPDSVVYDGMKKNKLNFEEIDTLLFGINIRMGRLNKSFKKTFKKLQKKNLNISYGAFVVAANEHERNKYMNLVQELLPEDSYVGFFGGELNPVNAKGVTKRVIMACIKDLEDQKLPLPSLNLDAIEDFAYHFQK
ncbi:MAG: hypothetical protein K2N64_05275 [Anaeroplasmataceae bacterium]|nr:hypothetical protein [Anaeroplasmataceae bacterium]